MLAALLMMLLLTPGIKCVLTNPTNYTVVLRGGPVTGELRPPARFRSPNNKFELELDETRFAVYQTCTDNIVFTTFGHGGKLTKLTLDAKGDLMLYGEPAARSNEILWESGTSAKDARFQDPQLLLSDDGFLALCSTSRCYWQSSGLVDMACRTSNSTKAKVVLEAGQTLKLAESIYSENRDFRLVFQRDGNLVLYRECDEAAVFSTYTFTSSVSNVTLNTDGNLVVYGSMRAKYGPLWFAEPWKSGNPTYQDRYSGSDLRLDNDGFLYMCKGGGSNCSWRSGYFHDNDYENCGNGKKNKTRHEALKQVSVSSLITGNTVLLLTLIIIGIRNC